MHKLLLTALLLSTAAASAEPDTTLKIDSNRVTVSGISAGGQMAHQLHISYSDLFSGAGILASGPFGCADGSLGTAMARCMGKTDGPLPVAELAAGIHTAAEQGLVADPQNLADDPVWLFHGTLDTTVATEVSDATGAALRRIHTCLTNHLCEGCCCRPYLSRERPWQCLHRHAGAFRG